jgi:hypothetical protein
MNGASCELHNGVLFNQHMYIYIYLYIYIYICIWTNQNLYFCQYCMYVCAEETFCPVLKIEYHKT